MSRGFVSGHLSTGTMNNSLVHFAHFANIETGRRAKAIEFLEHTTCFSPGCSENAKVEDYCVRHFGLVAVRRINKAIRELQEAMQTMRLLRSLVAVGQLPLYP